MSFTTLSTINGMSDADTAKVLDTQKNTPWHSSQDSAYTTSSRQAITAGTAYAFENDNGVFHIDNLPSHITKLWDTTDNKAVFTEELDHPVYVVRLALNFDPTVSSPDFIELRAYIDDPTTPKLIQTILVPYKASDTVATGLFTFYLGTEAGYDAKTNGVYFEYTAGTSGEAYDRKIFIYRT